MKDFSPQQTHMFLIGLAVLVVINTVALIAIGVSRSPVQDGTQLAPPPSLIPIEVANTPAGDLERYESPTYVVGAVESVSDSSIRVRTAQLGTSVASVSITVTGDTVLLRETVRKSDAEFSREVADFHKKITTAPGATEMFIAPSEYKSEAIDLSDFKVGDPISAIIIDTETNEAAKVTILQRP